MKVVAPWKARLNKALLASCVVVGFSGAVQGATYYVSTGGSDSNPGTQSAPFRHVSRGAAAAQAGDTVIVMNGTYDNEGQVADSGGGGSVVTMTNAGTAGNPITIMAQNRGGAILNAASSTQSSLGCYGAWAYFDLSYTAYVVIQGFVIENACVNGFHANANAHDITIKWNEIKNIGNWNNPASTLSPTGIYINSSEYNFTFDGNIWHDIGGGTNVNQQHAIYTAASSVTIVNNIFYNQVHGWDIQTAGGRNVYIANNTFAFANPNRDGQIVIWDDGNAGSLSNLIVENNVFYQPSNYAIVSALSGAINGCTMQYNVTTSGSMWDNGASCSMNNNMTSTDPMLMNPSGFDFHLQSGSPAIDSGMTVSYTAVDLDNWSRPVNNIYDRGAYEYHAAAPAPPPVVPPTISVVANPATVSVQQGGSATTAITATVSGGAAPSFSASGLPSGVSYSFSPSSCPASCTTTLTFTASSSAQGSSNVTVSASGAGMVATTTVPVSVVIPAPTPTPTPTSWGDYTTGLAGEWKLLGNANSSVGGDNGALQGGTSFANAPSLFHNGKYSALLLDGSSGYVSIGERSQLEMSNTLTVALWVRSVPSPTNNQGQRLIAKVYDWDIKLNGTNPQFTAGNQYAITNFSLPLYTWTHIAFTFSSGTVTAYVNGQAVGFVANTFSSGASLSTYPYGLYLGTDSSISSFFAGGMSDVRIYNRALSGADVQALYSAGTTAILH